MKKNVKIRIILLFTGILLPAVIQNAQDFDGNGVSGQTVLALSSQEKESMGINSIDTVEDLLVRLNQEALNTEDVFYKKHCLSILKVINSKAPLLHNDSSLLRMLYRTFFNLDVTYAARDLSSYTERKRPYIVSWTSPSDGATSLAWLIVPDNWDPDKQYPLYVKLHGLADVYTNPVEYMLYYLKPEPLVESSFDDGYVFVPWDRGNLWYEGIGETDIWEGMDVLEELVNVDPARKYLVGFSMGGYGTWNLGQKFPNKWAALGIYSGALQYNNNNLLSSDIAFRLKNLPVYIVCGTDDALLSENSSAYQLLQDAGNTNISYTTFQGGHVALLENWQNMYLWIREFKNDSVSTDVQLYNQNIRKIDLIDIRPNPFKTFTSIHYTIQKSGRVELAVFNALGQSICELASSYETAGEQEITWNGCDDKGIPVPGGIYICRLSNADYIISGVLYLAR
jgi:hypothetical protein